MESSAARFPSGRRKAATTLTEIPDHILAEIFLRLPAAEDLARASAACVTFRRLVIDTDGSFLRRFRRLHDPPLLAFFDRDGFHHALPPHPSAPAARALAEAADFSFSFLPDRFLWALADIRDGRVLFHQGKRAHVSMILAVCDPLHRKYVLLPAVPGDLATSVWHPDTLQKPWCTRCEVFLVPIHEEAEGAFGVLCMAHCDTRFAALVFSSSTGQWQAAASKEWRDLFLERGESTMLSPINHNFHERHYAYGCFYWVSTTVQKKEVLVLDTRRMEFSISDLPHPERCMSLQGLAVVEAGKGRLGLYGILETSPGKFDLCCYIKGNIGESTSQWQLEKTISLGSGCRCDIRAATGRYLLVAKFGGPRFVGSNPELIDAPREFISVDVKTLQLERVCRKSSGRVVSKTSIYTNYPPSLSSPTI